jgi:hypothetical protein
MTIWPKFYLENGTPFNPDVAAPSNKEKNGLGSNFGHLSIQ